MVNGELAPEAAAQLVPPLNVANAGPAPSRLAVLPVVVMAEKFAPGEAMSVVPAADRVIDPRASDNDPPDPEVKMPVWPAATTVPPGIVCPEMLPGVRIRSPPLSVSAPPPSLVSKKFEYTNWRVPAFRVIPPFKFAPLPPKISCPVPAFTNWTELPDPVEHSGPHR